MKKNNDSPVRVMNIVVDAKTEKILSIVSDNLPVDFASTEKEATIQFLASILWKLGIFNLDSVAGPPKDANAGNDSMTDKLLSYLADAFKDVPPEADILSLFSDIWENMGTLLKTYLEKWLIAHGMPAAGEPTEEPTAENTRTGWETE